MEMTNGATRWSHEQTWVSPAERDALRSIERRLRRDGMRIEAGDRVADWPFQLGGLALTAAGAMLVTLAAASAAHPLVSPLIWIGALLVFCGALVAVTPMRAAARRLTSRLPGGSALGRRLDRWFRERRGG